MRTNVHPIVLLLALAPLSSAACGSEDSSAAPTDVVEGPTPEEQEGAKMNVYISDCYNEIDQRVGRAVGIYTRFLDRSDDLANVRNPPSSLDPHVEADTCRSAVSRAAAMPPSLPALENAADAYATSIEVLLPVLAEAEQYYSRRTYRDDEMFGGRALHPRLSTAITAFRDSSHELTAQIDAVGTRRTEARLRALENDLTRRGTFLVERLQLHGRRLIDQDEQMVRALARDGEVPPALRDSYIASAGTLEAEVTELRDYQAAPGERLPRGLGQYQRQAENLLRGQTRVMRYVRDHARQDPETLQGHVSHAVTGFNDLVGAYNNLRFPD